jgi:hypothetical protein
MPDLPLECFLADFRRRRVAARDRGVAATDAQRSRAGDAGARLPFRANSVFFLLTWVSTT